MDNFPPENIPLDKFLGGKAAQWTSSRGTTAPGQVPGQTFYPNPAPEGRTETLQLIYTPQMLAVYIQYKLTYKKMYIPQVEDLNPAPEGRTETFRLTYILKMLAVYIQYKYIYITKCQLNLLIGIGYILPTFGEDTPFGGFLCALRAQG